MRWAPEAAWGVLPDSPAWTCVPTWMGEMSLRTRASLFAPQAAFGGWKRSVLLCGRRAVAGTVATPAWPAATAFLLDAALGRVEDPASPDCQDLRSFCVDYFTPPDPRRYTGVKVDALEVLASVESLILRLRVRGKDEVQNPELEEAMFSHPETPAPFRLRGAELRVEGEPLCDVESFALRAENHLAEGPPSLGRPAYLLAGQRTVRLELRRLHLDDLLNEAARDGAPLSFSARFAHPLGQTLDLELPCLHAADVEDGAPPSRVARSRAVLEAATDEQGRDIHWQFTPAMTTTTAGG